MVRMADLAERLQSAGLPEALVRDHLDRMEGTYFARYDPETIHAHIAMISRLGPANLAEVRVDALGPSEWRVTIVGFDYMAEMSTISGLMAANGLTILDGDVFTYASAAKPSTPLAAERRPAPRRRRTRPAPPPADISASHFLALSKIVDIFHVRTGRLGAPDWAAFEQELETALHRLKDHQTQEAQAQINLRVVDYLRQTASAVHQPLFPVHITVDNTASSSSTRLLIEGQDTPAFLYALSTALSLRDINIVRINIETFGEEVRDTVEVTDRQGRKITDTDKIHELKFVVALIKQFTHLLTRAPNPAHALAHFNQLIDQVLANVRSGRELEAIFQQLEKQRVIGAMARLFGTSDFLWEDFLRMQYKNLFPVLQDIEAVGGISKSRAKMEAELMARLSRVSGYDRKKALLNQYKDREMFRIDMRQILSDKEDFRAFSRELTDLAESVITAACRICDEELRRKYGPPRCASGEVCGISICALGKCGGREMGWASDIELLFVYAEQGKTEGPHTVHNSEYFERLVRMTCDTVAARREGIFEIDLRLRPYGDKGALACSFEMFDAYFNEKGGALPYERQALIKLRAIGGDASLGRRIEAARDAFVFSRAPLDLTALAHLRERQNNELAGPNAINVKYSYGGVIDIEYHVQRLQILHGADTPSVRSPNTLDALTALHRAGHVPDEDYRALSESYIFLRRLINALRIVRGNAKDLVLPDRDSQAFRFLARRLGYTESRSRDPAEQLWRDVRQYMAWAARTHRNRSMHKLFG
jgi:glutamate-ammonia-ligase adenylyltransferase